MGYNFRDYNPQQLLLLASKMLMLQMMGALSEFERALIRERPREGIAKAKTEGKYKGRRKALTSIQVGEIKARMENGEKVAALAREFGISRQTLYVSISER